MILHIKDSETISTDVKYTIKWSGRHTTKYFVGRDFSTHQGCLGCRGKKGRRTKSARTINKAGGMNEMCNPTANIWQSVR